ncbi:MAG: hypothetical protein FWF84_08060, partial [Kiritimatiellaeota bacterium]|nr:hypothetical protein [Kiritimatiellota bacterium]
IGALFDHEGDDIYRSIACSQAVAFFGAAILCDYAGNDRYESHQIAQAVGSVKGVAILADMGGNNSFYCKGDRQTSYGTRGHFEGWGQGVGFGVRPYASGGIGILYLGGGTNRLEAGTFAQGGGYYYGLGILYSDGDGDDTYIGTRYAQGFAAHQAAGAFIDVGGNDTYHTRYGVGHGLAWDESVSLFIDEAGDDTYTGGGFSLGATAMNALCLFHDKGGTDRFLSCKAGLQNGNSYHGGTSLSLFLKDGAGDSVYIDRAPLTTVVEPEHAVFIDRQ